MVMLPLGISVTGGGLPVNIKIYSPNKSLFFNKNFNTNNINIDSIPGTVVGETYQIVATDNCGTADSVSVGVTASIAIHSATRNCPMSKCSTG